MQPATRDSVFLQIAADNIRQIRFLFTDISGHIRSISRPASMCEDAFRQGICFDERHTDYYGERGTPDLLLIPDPASFRKLSHRTGVAREAQCICDVAESNGKPFEGDPRGVLKRVLNNASKEGYEFFTGPEMEFWLFQASAGNAPTQLHDNGSYFDLFPADNGVEIRREIVLALTSMGYVIEASHHEVARGQHEVPFRYSQALATADRIMTFKQIARLIARRHGAIASFIAKPEPGINGNALHIHASLNKDGTNVFYDQFSPNGLSVTAHRFIGGLLVHARGLCRIANTTINSFKRLTPGFEAPSAISWSTANRSALVRVPAARGNGTRIELRNPDAMCNPYLLLAGMMAAGMDGINNRIEPPEPADCNVYNLSKSERKRHSVGMLPADLLEAHESLLDDSLLRTTFGPYILDTLTRITNQECEEFRTAVHPWEIHRYYHWG